MVDGESFVNDLKTVTQECLANDKKDLKKYMFFKMNLLHSNIFAMSEKDTVTATTSKSAITTVSEKKENVDKLDNQINESLTLFDSVKKSVIENELKMQKMLIQNAIINEEKNNNQLWRKLKSKDIASFQDQSGYLASIKITMKGGKHRPSHPTHENFNCIPDWQSDQLPFDNVNGFNGAAEYDTGGYLTQLLIHAHQIDLIFQK